MGGPSRILGVAVVALLAVIGCDREEFQPAVFLDGQLDFKFLSGWIGANLMPVTPPDPFDASVLVEVTNLTSDPISEVTLPWADVFDVASAQKLGRIEFSTEWKGHLRLLADHGTTRR